MVTQRGPISTTLPLIELRSPTVPNKTNLIDPVYKHLCAAVRGPPFLRLLYLFIHPVLSTWVIEGSAWGEGKLSSFDAMRVEAVCGGGKIQKVSKLDQWSQQSIKGGVPLVSASDVRC